MPSKKKHKNALRGSTKMARLRAAAKPSISVKSLKLVSPLVGASVADAALATSVVPTSDSAFKSEIEIANQVTVQTGYSSELSAAQVSTDSLVLGEDEITTPGVEVEDEVCPVQGTVQSPREVEGRNYASFLKDSAKLEEIGTPSEHVSGVPFVLIPDENIVSAREEFKEFIYARFHGEWPAMGRIIGVVNALWARSGPRIFVHTIGEGEFLLRVPSATTRQMLLGRTCWNVAGFPMFVANWSPDFTPDEAPLTNAVIPVELRDVPYLLFNKESLSRLATAVGKPVSLAPETERKLNFKVAKLYVKVDLTKPLPRKIISGFSNGKESEIAVSYPWLPLRCDLCKKYGHSREKCRAQQGNASHRSRSKSPPKHGGRTRKSSRSSGVKLSTGTSSHHLINTPLKLKKENSCRLRIPFQRKGYLW
ncbi:unnamed protein product [Brassica rapa]|uniref:DUF4283 domain-containing protein n=1 Tax=Brassica campestris TaxID=3711 RepID=A0A3P5Y5F3_BRACM|nr:unnamed protein product [Brassica rapa]VDC62727.1 unnamed protein product [Brassica rapa]